MAINLSESLRLLALEAYRRRYVIIVAFAAIATLTTLVGINWSKKYTSYSTVYIEDQSVLEPLLHDGSHVPSDIKDRAMIAREVILGTTLLDKVVAAAWAEKDMDPVRKERIVKEVRARTMVTNVGDNLVRIEYSDSNPLRAKMVAQKLADFFIGQTLSAKANESASAVTFIDSQLQEYQKRLRTLQDRLRDFRKANADAQVGADVDSAHRLADLNDRLEQLTQDEREAEIRKTSLQSQLSGETGPSTASAGGDVYRQRIAQLRTQLETLRLTYRDSYPDVIALKGQIRELQREADAADKGKVDPGAMRLDAPALAGTLYDELRKNLYDAETAISTLKSRIADTQRQIDQEEERSRRIQAVSAQLSELTRDNDATAQVYQDLLRRREAARVAMNLNREKAGVTMRVEQAAVLPRIAEGPSLVFFMLGGVLAGVVLPIGMIFGLQQVDPRIRHASAIHERLGLAVLGVVPHLHTPREGAAEARGAFSLGLVVVATLSIVAALGAMRMTGAL